MAKTDDPLLAVAQNFADEVADLLDKTITQDAPMRAQVVDDRVDVAALSDVGESVAMPLTIEGQHRLDLRVRFGCTFDFTGQFLAIEQSEFALVLPTVRQPVVRFDYVRERAWGSAHVQLHAESSAVGYLRAHARKPSEVWRLHLPVGGRRFRPSVEDVIEFAVHEFGVDTQQGWEDRVLEGRSRWRRLQVKGAIRDVIKDDPATAPDELKETIEAAEQAIAQGSDQDT
jgi:hypothetical protein